SVIGERRTMSRCAWAIVRTRAHAHRSSIQEISYKWTPAIKDRRPRRSSGRLEGSPCFDPRIHVVRPFEFIKCHVARGHVDPKLSLVLRAELCKGLVRDRPIVKVLRQSDPELR